MKSYCPVCRATFKKSKKHLRSVRHLINEFEMIHCVRHKLNSHLKLLIASFLFKELTDFQSLCFLEWKHKVRDVHMFLYPKEYYACVNCGFLINFQTVEYAHKLKGVCCNCMYYLSKYTNYLNHLTLNTVLLQKIRTLTILNVRECNETIYFDINLIRYFDTMEHFLTYMREYFNTSFNRCDNLLNNLTVTV
jgi:hypothetical protein